MSYAYKFTFHFRLEQEYLLCRRDGLGGCIIAHIGIRQDGHVNNTNLVFVKFITILSNDRW